PPSKLEAAAHEQFGRQCDFSAARPAESPRPGALKQRRHLKATVRCAGIVGHGLRQGDEIVATVRTGSPRRKHVFTKVRCELRYQAETTFLKRRPQWTPGRVPDALLATTGAEERPTWRSGPDRDG